MLFPLTSITFVVVVQVLALIVGELHEAMPVVFGKEAKKKSLLKHLEQTIEVGNFLYYHDHGWIISVTQLKHIMIILSILFMMMLKNLCRQWKPNMEPVQGIFPLLILSGEPLHCIALWLPRLRRGGAGVEGRILVYNFGEIELCPLLRGVNNSGQE